MAPYESGLSRVLVLGEISERLVVGVVEYALQTLAAALQENGMHEIKQPLMNDNHPVEVIDERMKVLTLPIGAEANIEGIKFRVERIIPKKKRVILCAAEKCIIFVRLE